MVFWGIWCGRQEGRWEFEGKTQMRSDVEGPWNYGSKQMQKRDEDVRRR